MTGTRHGIGTARTAHAGEAALADTLASLSGPSSDALPPVSTGSSRFEPLSLLGEGGMGRVHVARDTQIRA